MRYTNRYGAPQPLYNLLTRDDYSRGDAQISATQLIAAPRIRLLRRRHWHEMEEDVSDALWRMMGQALHVVAEKGADEEHLPEERLFAEVHGWKVSGAMDVQKVATDRVVIGDYKFTSIYAVDKALNGEKVEWENQLNVYAWLLRQAKNWRVDRLEIYALIRDWNRNEAQRKSNQGYPPAPIFTIPITLWSDEDQDAYVSERIRLHQEAERRAEWDDGELPDCTPEDTWERRGGFAVMKKGGKRARRVFEHRKDAEAFMADDIKEKDRGQYFIEERPTRRIRCEGDYCGVAQWCGQFRRFLEDQNLSGNHESGDADSQPRQDL